MRVFPVETVPDRPTAQENETGLKEAMDSLPEKLRLALLLKYMEGMTEKEAALALNISLTTLKSRLFRGRKALANWRGWKGTSNVVGEYDRLSEFAAG